MNTKRPSNLAELLKWLRDNAGLTQEELAEKAKVSPRSISDIERGISKKPRKGTIETLAEALELKDRDLELFKSMARGQVVAWQRSDVNSNRRNSTILVRRVKPMEGVKHVRPFVGYRNGARTLTIKTNDLTQTQSGAIETISFGKDILVTPTKVRLQIGVAIALITVLVIIALSFAIVSSLFGRPVYDGSYTQAGPASPPSSNSAHTTPTFRPAPTLEPLKMESITFSPTPPAKAETVAIYACTTGLGGVGVTLRVSINTSPDGTDQGEWKVLKELGVPCFNAVDAPTWDTKDWQAGKYLIKAEARKDDDPQWERALVTTAVYTLLK